MSTKIKSKMLLGVTILVYFTIWLLVAQKIKTLSFGKQAGTKMNGKMFILSIWTQHYVRLAGAK